MMKPIYRIAIVVVIVIFIGWGFVEYLAQDEKSSDLTNSNDLVNPDLNTDIEDRKLPVTANKEDYVSKLDRLEETPENHIELSIQNLKQILDEIVRKRENPERLEEFHSANLELEYILEFWSPIGLTLEQLTEILGEPNSKTPTEVSYAIRGPYNSHNATFRIEDGLVQGPEPYLDLKTDSLSEELIFRLTQRYRNIHGLRSLYEESKNTEFYSANSSLNNLLYFWNPDGLSVDKLKAMIGEPDWESANEFGYNFDTGKVVYKRDFILEEGRVRLK